MQPSSNLNQKTGQTIGRVLWYDPNPLDNEPINTEDLNISVSLDATSKNKTLITKTNNIVAVVQSNDNGKNKTIQFIRSSEKEKPGSLTTSYTEIEQIQNNNQYYDGNGYESLGIESINIEFNSSYAPMIKIKMIDIRGASLFSNQGKGDYNFFFELPYPLFHLEIKGFYGRPVNYCLHLIRFNASFNSDTGNFEIDCDFIGYTYALLNDMLMGMLRGVQDTKIGDSVFKEIKNEYNDNIRPQIIKIDELIEYIDKGNFILSEGISKNETLSKDLTNCNDIKNGLEIIKNNIQQTIRQIKDIYNDNKDIVIYSDFYSIILAEDKQNLIAINNLLRGEGGYDSVSKANLEILNKLLKDKNIITIDETHIKYNTNLDNISITKKDIPEKNVSFKDEKIFETITNDKNLNYKEDLDKINIITKLYGNKNKIETDETKLIIIDFNYAAKKLDEFTNTVIKKINELETKIVDELNTKIYEKTKKSSTTSIRNLFRVLGTGVDTFLKTLYEVSKKADDNDSLRANEFKKITSSSNKNLIDYDITTKVSPWPEYRELDNEYYTEKYLGSRLNAKNVPELDFVEDLMKTMIEQKRAELENLNANNGNIVNQNNNWFPISVLDNGSFEFDNKKMTGNPYLVHINEGYQTPDDMIKVLLLRMFLLLGFSNKNRIDDTLIKFHGQLEAINLVYVLSFLKNNNDNLLKQRINNLDFNNLISDAKFNNIIFESGEGNNYDYKYITDIEYGTAVNSNTNKPLPSISVDYNFRSYLPVNKKFDKKDWYKPNTDRLKSISDINKLINDNGIISAGNQNNYIEYTDNNIKFFKNIGLNEIDNSQYINFIKSSDFEKYNFNPNELLLDTPNKQTYYDKYPNSNKHPKYTKKDIINIDKTDYYQNPITKFNNKSNYGFINTYRYSDENDTKSSVSFFTDDSNDKFKGFYVSNFLIKFSGNTFENTYIKYDPDEIEKETEPVDKYFDIRYRFKGIEENENGTYFHFKNNQTTYQRVYYNSDRLIEVFNNIYKVNINTFKTNYSLALDKNTDYYIPFIGFSDTVTVIDLKLTSTSIIIPYSLFGSRLYYSQDKIESKAYLFLHTFPFQGLARDNSEDKSLNHFIHTILDYNDSVNNNFETYGSKITNNAIFKPVDSNLKNLFRLYNGMVKTPKIWVLFIGSIFWRLKQSTDPIISPKDSNNKEIYVIPNQKELMVKHTENNTTGFLGMLLSNNSKEYKKIDSALLGLPDSIKNNFIDEFIDWVKNDFNSFRYELEIKDENNKLIEDTTKAIENLKKLYNFLFDDTTINNSNRGYIELKKLHNNPMTKNLLKNYHNIGPYKEKDDNLNLVKPLTQINMLLRPKTPIMNKLMDLITERIYIQNANPFIWNPLNLNDYEYGIGKPLPKYHKISVNSEDFESFYTSFKSTFDTLTKDFNNIQAQKIAEAKKSLFGLQDNDLIRLNIYRTLSAIYQKWISGFDNDEFFSQCSYNKTHEEVASKERNTYKTPRLLDSFRFVDRAFRDLGDKLYVNPKIFVDVIRNNQNATFFDVANKVLNDNNFLFIPLPTYINYNKKEDLEDVFKPIPNNVFTNEETGPSFVCVYVGQVSNNLALEYTDGTTYPDDGIYVNIDENNNMIGLPDDFTTSDGTSNPYELKVPIFTVNYGQQNQNFFKNVRLDQKEFTETAESLEIINDLSNQGDKTKETYVGQNLFNVYQKRSYSCEVEMLGDALIQPMMYFQLNNIPMFRGLYLIINVKHNIKPNSMVTTFKGVRVKKYKTPLLDINNVLYFNETNKTTSSTSPNYVTSVTNFCKKDTVKLIKSDTEFLKGIKEITDFLNETYECEVTINPWDLLGLIEHESACTFDPAVVNTNTDNNYGLIQFTKEDKGRILQYSNKDSSKKLKVDELIKLTRAEQVSYVYGFIRDNVKGKISLKTQPNQNLPKLSLGRLYLIVFLPAKVDNLDDVVVSKNSIGREYGYWNENKSLHDNTREDKAITVTFLGDLIKTKGNKYKNLNFG